MDITDILLLIKAGYTKEEIENAQLLAQKPADPNPESVPVPVQTAEPQTKPADPPAQVAEPVAEPVPTAVPQPAQQEAQPTMAEIMQSIAKLTSAVQANAIAQSVIPQGVSTPPKAEDMIAEIIRPTFKERG